MDCKQCWRWSRRLAMFGAKYRPNLNKSNQQSPINRMIGQQMMSIAMTKAVSQNVRVTSDTKLLQNRITKHAQTHTKAIDKIKALWLLLFSFEIYGWTIKKISPLFFSIINFLSLLSFYSVFCIFFSLFLIFRFSLSFLSMFLLFFLSRSLFHQSLFFSSQLNVYFFANKMCRCIFFIHLSQKTVRRM